MSKIIVFAALTLALCMASVVTGQEPSQTTAIPNLHEVNASLYRGAQPKPGGLLQLKQLGVKTILNLRDDDERAKSEATEAQSLGLRYFNIPLSNFSRPDDKVVEQILALINSTENQPLFVHCKRGSDRTGTIIAVYRIAHDGWTSEKAQAEAKQYGLGFWQMGMKDYIHDYYERHSRQPDDQTTKKPIQ